MFVRWLERALEAAEGARPGLVALPASGESGVSLGRLQMDLSQQAALRRDLARAARRMLVPGDVDGLLAKRVRVMAPSDRENARRLLEHVLERPDGAAWLARHERAMAVRVGLAVRRLIAFVAPGAADFANSLRGQIEIGCHLHQFGTGSTEKLSDFLAGKRVTFDEKRSAAFRAPLDLEQFRGFRRATRWGFENPRANESRHMRVDLALRDVARGA
ncbi:MAG: hypothetical protein HY059_00975 [Proteobacteria bacterium]|nr:hypothetical protein [Pseudomonadota bacterium]